MNYYMPKRAGDESPSKIHNPNCDGDHCRAEAGEVKAYPLGGGANLILCMSCWARENRYRFECSREQGQENNWPQENWWDAPTYKGSD